MGGGAHVVVPPVGFHEDGIAQQQASYVYGMYFANGVIDGLVTPETEPRPRPHLPTIGAAVGRIELDEFDVG